MLEILRQGNVVIVAFLIVMQSVAKHLYGRKILRSGMTGLLKGRSAQGSKSPLDDGGKNR